MKKSFEEIGSGKFFREWKRVQKKGVKNLISLKNTAEKYR